MLEELRLAARSLARTPALAATIIAILAITIGANTAIFSVLESLLLRPLPLREPERLVHLYESFPSESGAEERVLDLSETTLRQWREGNTVFSGIGAASSGSLTLTGRGEPQYVPAARVSANFFPVLGVSPILGRSITEAEDQPNGAHVVVVSYRFWQQTLGGRPDALGQQLTLDGKPHTVIGVMAPGFNHPFHADVWVPLAVPFDPAAPRPHYLYAPARLKDGVTLDAARAAMRDLCARYQQSEPSPTNPLAANIQLLHDGFVSDVRPKLLTIAVAALFVLLIAAANVASLLLVRQIERQADTTLRAALGASRSRIVREYLWQGLILALVGCTFGVLIALVGTPLLYDFSPMGDRGFGFGGFALNEFNTRVAVDLPVLLGAAGITLLVGFGAGFFPALRTSRRIELRSALQGGSRGGALDRGARNFLGTLVVVEIAIALLLLAATALLGSNLERLMDRPWGLATEHRAAFTVSFSDRVRPEHAQRMAFAQEAVARLRALPGVKSVTASNFHPLEPGLAAVTPEGSKPPISPGFYTVRNRQVFPGYFREMQIPVLRGRALDEGDRADGRLVTVVSESFAKHFWPGQDPIGKRIKRGRPDSTRPWIEIVGVVPDTRGVNDGDMADVIGAWYLPYAQHPGLATDNLSITIEAAVDPESLQPAVRTVLASVDAGIAPFDFRSYARTIGETTLQDRYALLLMALFGAVGLFLSVLGLYGLLSFQVAMRTRELGVRAALGAQAIDLTRMVLRRAGGLVVFGLLLGVGLTLASVRMATSLLPQSFGFDAASLFAAALLLALTAGVACWVPARRAARVDPMVSLRGA